jgi:type III restriction enzyme
LNWALAKTLKIEVSEDDRILYRKDGEMLEKCLFEKVYQRDFNTLERGAGKGRDTLKVRLRFL